MKSLPRPFALLLATLAASSPAAAALCPVPTATYPTISSAIADGACHEIQVAAGTYEENLGITRDLTLRGAGADRTTIDGGGKGSTVIVVDVTVEISDLTLTGGEAAAGGGLAIHGGDVTVLRSRLVDNHAGQGGGAMVFLGTLTMRDSTVSGNRSEEAGAGILLNSEASELRNVTISGNQMNGERGVAAGLMLVSGSLFIGQSTITENRTNAGSAIGGLYAVKGSSVTLEGTLIAGNIDVPGGDLSAPDCFEISSLTSLGYNLIGDATDCATPLTATDVSGTGASPLDARLEPLAFNGGPTETHALRSGSPAIDAGGPACGALDQRGVERPVGAACDIGAFELAVVEPPVGPWLSTSALPGFRAKVRITSGTTVSAGEKVSACIVDTLCVSGAVAGRPEVFVRVVGPKPNGRLWPTLAKFSTSQIEVWIEQQSTGEVRYYRLEGAKPGDDSLPGLFDREGFTP